MVVWVLRLKRLLLLNQVNALQAAICACYYNLPCIIICGPFGTGAETAK